MGGRSKVFFASLVLAAAGFAAAIWFREVSLTGLPEEQSRPGRPSEVGCGERLELAPLGEDLHLICAAGGCETLFRDLGWKAGNRPSVRSFGVNIKLQGTVPTVAVGFNIVTRNRTVRTRVQLSPGGPDEWCVRAYTEEFKDGQMIRTPLDPISRASGSGECATPQVRPIDISILVMYDGAKLYVAAGFQANQRDTGYSFVRPLNIDYELSTETVREIIPAIGTAATDQAAFDVWVSSYFWQRDFPKLRSRK